MSYYDFFEVACYINSMNRGKFTQQEIHENASAYYQDYLLSVMEKQPQGSIVGLIKELDDTKEIASGIICNMIKDAIKTEVKKGK